MQWWEETVHALVVMHNWKQQKQLEEGIRDLVRLAVERARLRATSRGTKTGSEGRSTEPLPHASRGIPVHLNPSRFGPTVATKGPR